MTTQVFDINGNPVSLSETQSWSPMLSALYDSSLNGGQGGTVQGQYFTSADDANYWRNRYKEYDATVAQLGKGAVLGQGQTGMESAYQAAQPSLRNIGGQVGYVANQPVQPLQNQSSNLGLSNYQSSFQLPNMDMFGWKPYQSPTNNFTPNSYYQNEDMTFRQNPFVASGGPQGQGLLGSSQFGGQVFTPRNVWGA